jgi:Uma2 family endonuclease
MVSQAPRRASYEDVLRAPPHVIAELIAGTLHTQPRPTVLHARASSSLGAELGAPFERARGGPGGWLILDEPELHLGAEPDILVPDLAGWRRTTLPELPDVPFLTLAPDWVCEVLSPGTRRHDRVLKLPLYKRERVAHVWLVDPEAKTLEVYKLDGDSYRLLSTHAESEVVHAEPFEVFALELGVLWQR